jgi:hypothetical protein
MNLRVDTASALRHVTNGGAEFAARRFDPILAARSAISVGGRSSYVGRDGAAVAAAMPRRCEVPIRFELTPGRE